MHKGMCNLKWAMDCLKSILSTPLDPPLVTVEHRVVLVVVV